MKGPTVLQSLCVAFTLASAASALSLAGFYLLPTWPTFNMCTVIIFTSYSLYILFISKNQAGKVGACLVTAILAAISCLVPMSIVSLILMFSFFICMLRSVFINKSLFARGLDFSLTTLSIVCGVGTWIATDSVFTTTWVTFLIHGLFVLIPQKLPGSFSKIKSSTDLDPFERAYLTAEGALTRIIEKS